MDVERQSRPNRRSLIQICWKLAWIFSRHPRCCDGRVRRALQNEEWSGVVLLFPLQKPGLCSVKLRCSCHASGGYTPGPTQPRISSAYEHSLGSVRPRHAWRHRHADILTLATTLGKSAVHATMHVYDK